jgi:hypothetical protein
MKQLNRYTNLHRQQGAFTLKRFSDFPLTMHNTDIFKDSATNERKTYLLDCFSESIRFSNGLPLSLWTIQNLTELKLLMDLVREPAYVPQNN